MHRQPICSTTVSACETGDDCPATDVARPLKRAWYFRRRGRSGGNGGDGLQIHLLGDLRLVSRGQALALPPSKKTRALLAYLVATGRPHLRARLCDLLWEGPDDPRGALRWSLAKLRPLLDEEGLRGSSPTRARYVCVAWGRCGRHAARTSGVCRRFVCGDVELKGAAALFSGEFAEGLDLPACYRFHEWCTAEREKVDCTAPDHFNCIGRAAGRYG